jgi:hypothetical protein
MKKIDLILKEFNDNKIVKRKTLNELLWWGRNITSLIQVLQKKGHVIETTYDTTSSHPIVYTYIEYVVPFYIMSRDIEHSYPEFAERIRSEYNKLISN